MGWGGAGLGANEQGIAEPIKGGEVWIDQYYLLSVEWWIDICLSLGSRSSGPVQRCRY